MANTIYSDQELIAGLAQNDSKAIKEIYRLYQSMLTKWIMSRGGEENDAYDIFQDGLMVLYNKSKDADFCLTCKLNTYLFAVCKRLWYKKREAKSLITLDGAENEEQGENEEQYYDDIDIHLEKEAHFKILETAMEQLGHPCNGLLKAFYFDAKSMQDIASDFGYTNAENAKSQKYKCLARLKKIFFSKKN